MGLEIHTLGRFAVSLDGRDYGPILAQPVRAAVLLYLAVERETTREALAAVIWSDRSPESARRSLNQTLYLLRRELGEDWLMADGDRLAVTERLRMDTVAMDAAVADGRWAIALELYQGPFLDGWHLLDSSPFEHWVDGVRLRLARLHRQAERERIGALRQAGELEAAVEVARAWIRTDPLEDEANHALIELLAATGRRTEALEQYQAYARTLAADDLRPLEQTEVLVRTLRETSTDVDGACASRPEDLSGGPPPVGPMPESAPVGRQGGREFARRRLLYAVAVAALAAVAVILAALFAADTASPSLERSRALVAPLENRTGDPELDPVGMMVADWMTQGLASLKFLDVVPYAELVKFNGGSGDVAPSASSEARAFTAAATTGAGTVVTGRYYAAGDGLEIHVLVTDVASGKLLETIGPIRTLSADLGQAADVLRQRVMASLAVRLDASLGGIFDQSAMPPSYEAYLAYHEGTMAIVLGDWGDALPDLLRANELEPTFTSPLIFAGFAFMNAKQDFARADSVAQVVEDSRATLPRYDRLRLDLLQATLKGDAAAAYRAVREAADITPGGSAHFTAAELAVKVNRPRESLALLGTFDPERPIARQWTPYWSVLTEAYHLLGEHGKELKAARRGRDLIPGRIEMLVYEARALAALGRTRELERILVDAAGYPSRRTTPADVMLTAARELRAHGHPRAARSAAEGVLDWYAALPAERRDSEQLRAARGSALYLADRFDEGRKEFERLRIENVDDPTYLRYLGAIAARSGDRAGAIACADSLAAMDRPYLFGRHTYGRAVIEGLLGERQTAVTLLREALSRGLPYGTQLHSDPDLLNLRGFEPFDRLLHPEG
ncbi:MAG: BTAD domain-containing putative transcriptional regulator [Gemmatimonadota bacterium]